MCVVFHENGAERRASSHSDYLDFLWISRSVDPWIMSQVKNITELSYEQA